jgi:hypothetical protein
MSMVEQVENRHPSLELLLRDVGLHLDHSVKSLEADEAAVVGNVYPRFDRTLSYHPQPLHSAQVRWWVGRLTDGWCGVADCYPHLCLVGQPTTKPASRVNVRSPT